MLTFGADPEVFAVKYDNDIPYVISPALMEKFYGLEMSPSVTYSSKQEKIKHPVYINTPIFKWMQDGVAWELTIKSYKTSLTSVQAVIKYSVESLMDFMHRFKGLSVYSRPVVNINPEEYLPYLNEERIYQGFIFGCDPDEDAIIPDYKCETVDVTTHKFRYGGGHIHIGSNSDFEVKAMHHLYNPFIKLLAIHLGTVCTAFSPFPEEDKIRVERYGMPGRFRRPPHGIEYRSPSNSWINLDKHKITVMDAGARRAFELLLKPQEGKKVINKYLDGAVEAIVNCNQDLAEQIASEVV